MDYKITVERIEPPKEGEKYNGSTTLYEQTFSVRDELDNGEKEMLVKIIDSVNK